MPLIQKMTIEEFKKLSIKHLLEFKDSFNSVVDVYYENLKDMSKEQLDWGVDLVNDWVDMVIDKKWSNPDDE